MHQAPVVLLDRDGTIIADRHYLADPDQVELLPRAAEGLRRRRPAPRPPRGPPPPGRGGAGGGGWGAFTLTSRGGAGGCYAWRGYSSATAG
jgi:hypothetical protein